MPKPLCPVIKKQIIYHVKVLNSSVDHIFKELFHNDPGIVSIRWLKMLIRKIGMESDYELELWGNTIPYYPGRPRMMHRFERDSLVDMMISESNKRLTTLTKEFAETFYGIDAEIEAPSLSTVRRSLIRAGFTRKIMTRLNANIDASLREEFYDIIAFVDPHHIIDID